MGTIIRADCDRCGTVEVAMHDARLEVALDGAARATALVTCPRCGTALAQRVGDRATRLLSAAGIEFVAATPAPDRAAVTDS